MLLSVISFAATRYMNHIESRWDTLETRFNNYVTLNEFTTYQRMHKDWGDAVLATQSNDMKEIARRLMRLEERQEKLLDMFSNGNGTGNGRRQ